MKHLYYLPLILFFYHHTICAQIQICKNVYVWNFLNEHGLQDRNTRIITDEFENSLTQQNSCIVLDRLDFSKNYEHNKNEKEVISLNDVEEYQVKLKTIKAEMVVFGKITMDEISNLYVLKVKFQNMETSQIRGNSVNIPVNEIRDLNLLHTRIGNFVCTIINGSDCKASKKPDEPPTIAKQNDWRWCHKCSGLFYASGQEQVGKCAIGGQHEKGKSGNYTIVHNTPGFNGQHDWRWCHKCSGLFHASGQENAGTCPLGGQHSKRKSGDYALPHNTPNFDGQQDWRWCNKCSGLFYAGGRESTGKCPAEGQHEKGKSGNYGLWHTLN